MTSSVERLYSRILKKTVERQIQEINEQIGFCTRRFSLDIIFVLQKIIEKRLEKNMETCSVFIDSTKTYDNVPLKKMFDVLGRSSLDSTYIRGSFEKF